jgi:hypothetical protein
LYVSPFQRTDFSAWLRTGLVRKEEKGVRSFNLTFYRFVPGFVEIVSSIYGWILVWFSDALGSGSRCCNLPQRSHRFPSAYRYYADISDPWPSAFTNQFIAIAVAEKISALETEKFFAERAKQVYMEEFRAILFRIRFYEISSSLGVEIILTKIK